MFNVFSGCLRALVAVVEEHIVFEPAFLHSNVGESHLALAMLDAVAPLALVDRAVDPTHLTESVPFIVLVAAFVDVAAFPSENSVPILFVALVTAFVCVAVRHIIMLLPLTLTVLESFLEFANEHTAILPLVLPLPIRLSVFILACV